MAADLTMAAVARHLGVSQATVGAALNGRGGNTRVSPAQALRIREAAAELGYRPNAAARATATGRFNAVAILQSTFKFRSFLPGTLFDAVHDTLAEHGMHLVVSKVADEKLEDETYVPQLLRELICDGLLVNYQAFIPSHLEELVERHRLPAFWINSPHTANCVMPEETAAGYHATRRLLDLGHRRIAFAMFHDFSHFSTFDRYGGYRKALEEAGLEPRLAKFEEMLPPEIHARLMSAFHRPDAPTAVLAYTDVAALTYLRAALAAGLRVPNDFSVISFNSEPILEVDRDVATMLLPEREMGTAAVEGLLRLIDQPDLRLPPQVLPCGFFEGQTLAPPPAGHPRRPARRRRVGVIDAETS